MELKNKTVLVVLPPIPGKVHMEQKYSELAFWGIVFKTYVKIS